MKFKQGKMVIPYCIATLGVLLLWGGMIYSLGTSNIFRPCGIAIAFIGLIVVVLSYPLKIRIED